MKNQEFLKLSNQFMRCLPLLDKTKFWIDIMRSSGKKFKMQGSHMVFL
jgi:hypothetical protein